MSFNPHQVTLALDCSVKNITLAIIQDGKILSFYNQIPEQPQSAVLMKVIDDVLQQGNVKLSDIQNVLFCHGPGSFTSLRIGLATLKGLFLGSEVNFLQTSSLHFRCLSAGAQENRNVISIINMGRQKVAVGILKGEGSEFSEKVMAQEEYEEYISKANFVVNENKTSEEAFVKILNLGLFESLSLEGAGLNYMVGPNLG